MNTTQNLSNIAEAASLPASPEPAIDVSHLVKLYKSTRAVDDISFSIPRGSVTGLLGGNGAGKTTFVQGLARGLGVTGRVSSPTFVLVHEYAAGRGLRLVHVDTYRLGVSAAGEAEAMGLDELLADPGAVVAIEWAERVAGLLPADHLLIELGYGAAEEERG